MNIIRTPKSERKSFLILLERHLVGPGSYISTTLLFEIEVNSGEVNIPKATIHRD